MTYSPIPKWTITDTNGEPVVSGTLYFYEAGTTTPKNVYSDAARTVSAGAELITDSLGQVGPVYLDTAAATKCVCKDADDVTLWTVDNLTAPSGETTTVTAVNRSVSPLDYGAVGDGAADEATEVQQALDAGSGFVDLAGGTYRCDSALTLPAGTRLINGTLDFSQMASGAACISATGSLGSAVFTSADIDGGDKTVTLSSTASFTSGRWVKLSSNAAWGAVSSTKDGELARIFSVLSGTVLWLDGLSVDGYTVANSAKAEQLTTVSNITLEDVHITGTTLTSASVLEFIYGERVSLRNVNISSYSFAGIRMTSCVDCNIDGCTVAESTSGTGILIDGTSQRVSIDASKISESPTGVSIGRADDGVCRFITLSQCSIAAGALTGSTCVKFNQDSQFCSVINSSLRGGRTSTGAAYGVVDYGSANRVIYCDIVGVEDSCILSEYRVSKSPSFNGTDTSPAFAYIGNTMQSLDDAVVIAPYSGMALDGGLIARNRIQYAAVNALELNSVASISNLVIDSNLIGDARVCLDMSGVSAFSNIQFTRNTVRLADQLADLDIDATSKLVFIQDNAIYQDGLLNAFAIDVNVATLVNFTGLHIDRNTFVCASASVEQVIRLTSTDAGRLSGFTINDNRIELNAQQTTEAAIELNDVCRGQVCGNSIYGDEAIYGMLLQTASATVSQNMTEILIARNNIRFSGTGGLGQKGVYINAAGSANLQDISITDNIIDCGASNIDYGLQVAVATGQTIERLMIRGNQIFGSEVAVEGVNIVSTDADGILDTTVCGNTIDTVGTAYTMNNCKFATISGNTFRTRNTTSDNTLVLTDCEAINVASNLLVNDKTDGTASVCAITGAAVTGILFSGNIVSGGFYGLRESATATTTLAAIGNLFVGGASSYLHSTGGGWDLGVTSTTNTDFKNGY